MVILHKGSPCHLMRLFRNSILHRPRDSRITSQFYKVIENAICVSRSLALASSPAPQFLFTALSLYLPALPFNLILLALELNTRFRS